MTLLSDFFPSRWGAKDGGRGVEDGKGEAKDAGKEEAYREGGKEGAKDGRRRGAKVAWQREGRGGEEGGT